MAAVFCRHLGRLVSNVGQMPTVYIPFPPSEHAVGGNTKVQYLNREIEYSKPCVTKQLAIADIKYQCANAAHKHL